MLVTSPHSIGSRLLTTARSFGKGGSSSGVWTYLGVCITNKWSNFKHRQAPASQKPLAWELVILISFLAVLRLPFLVAIDEGPDALSQQGYGFFANAKHMKLTTIGPLRWIPPSILIAILPVDDTVDLTPYLYQQLSNAPTQKTYDFVLLHTPIQSN
eukprot:3871300-Amphidinium_carterae.2